MLPRRLKSIKGLCVCRRVAAGAARVFRASEADQKLIRPVAFAADQQNRPSQNDFLAGPSES